jgi:hypothetical protein
MHIFFPQMVSRPFSSQRKVQNYSEGVSLVNNYRTQFNTIIAKDSYAGLVKQMRLKLQQENATSPQKG